ncbi:MAG: PSD1 and planctomycete cytochrome C domain-containing protein [Verrucomicrobiales bacterium]|nr:PSD1 and planctomycete cytochrome C domain-containing protein [Verrucomicrobiales bacterium]
MKYFALLCFFVGTVTAADTVQFNRDIRPILSDRCFHCHGPDEHERKADLRLDQTGGEDGAYRALDGVAGIVPGSLEESEVWYRIISDDEDDVMPPPDSHKKPLTDREKELFKKWIEEGAKYEEFWAFVPPAQPETPRVKNLGWSEKPIDLFVMRKLEEKGLQPKEQADRRTLIRRLSFDLTGLPPTREEIASFLSDERPDAWEQLVEQYLARPQYGEHMAKYWLDLVRFADTNGIHHDHYRDLSPYRSWVIRAFNQNLPYDEFTTYQLAGDLLPNPTQDQLIASGFHRLHLIIDRGTMLPEESFARNVLDRVESVGTAFMGLTVQCAVCHDHKYDPITAKDFFQLSAFFNNIDATPETGGRSGNDFKRGLQPPYIEMPTPKQEKQRAELVEMEKVVQKELELLKKSIAAAADPEKAELEKAQKAADAKLKKIRSDKANLEMTIPAAMVMKERPEVRPAHILIRGAYDNPGEEVGRDTPGFLPPLKPENPELKTRLDLARWFVTAENPLTARVAVNRFWQQIFGVGIVKTSEDLGAQGEWPSHPDLLDYLATRFVESGWDVKALIREMVLSETYRQSSNASPEEFEADPENRWLARGSRYRFDSEVIRDQILATSGLLNEEMYGKSVKPPQPEGLWKAVALPSSYPNRFAPDTGDKIRRRSVYTFWKRGLPPPQMTILNAPTRESCTARRERTNTPLQALLLMNETEYLKAARHFAKRVLEEEPKDRLDFAYETITSQVPDQEEAETLKALLEDLQVSYQAKPELATSLTEGESVELAAWTMVINTLYNLDITKTRQ